MTPENLKKANALTRIIETTKVALDRLYSMHKDIRKGNKLGQNAYDDGLYCLVIGQYDDGSDCAKLDRYRGNLELYDVIIETLERQLIQFKKEFAAL